MRFYNKSEDNSDFILKIGDKSNLYFNLQKYENLVFNVILEHMIFI